MPHTRDSDKKKLVLIGMSGAGKTSMRSMIFANYSADDTKKLLPTLDAETTHVRILDKYTLNVWDLGGQQAFNEHWNRNLCNTIYADIHILIFVLDCSSDTWMNDLSVFVEALKHLRSYSQEAKIFFMIHKVDKIAHWKDPARAHQHKMAKLSRLEKFKKEIEAKVHAVSNLDDSYKNRVLNSIKYRMTTIFDDSLYSAWGEVISNIVPNITEYERKIRSFCSKIKADEIVLFEKTTFLALASCRAEFIPRERHREVNENMTNTLKNIHSGHASHASSRQKKGQNFTFKTSKYQLFFRQFTPNTCILLVFYMTEQRRNRKFGRYLCQHLDVNEPNEDGEPANHQYPANLQNLARLGLSIDRLEEASKMTTEKLLTTPDLTLSVRSSHGSKFFSRNSTIAKGTENKDKNKEKDKDKADDHNDEAINSNTNVDLGVDEDFQHRLDDMQTSGDLNKPNFEESSGFEHSALIETCIKEFCDDMKELDSGNVKSKVYQPRH